MSTSSLQALACVTPTCPRYAWPTPNTQTSCPTCHQPLVAEPAQPLAVWPAPAWAEVSHSNDPGLVQHSWTHPQQIEVQGLDDDVPDRIGVEVAQSDEIDLKNGAIRVRRTEPLVYIGSLIMAPCEALKLATAVTATCYRLSFMAETAHGGVRA